MSTSINIKAYSSKNNKEFQRHYNVVMCCIENSVSFPKETSEFFKGKVVYKLADLKRDKFYGQFPYEIIYERQNEKKKDHKK